MHKRVAILAVYCLAIVGYAAAQSTPQNAPAADQSASQPAQTAASATSGTSADAQAKPTHDDAADSKNPKTSPAAAQTSAANHTPVSAVKIASGSKIYVAPMGGFESYVVAGIMKKKVPVSIVADRDKADYEIKGAAESEKAGWAKIVFLRTDSSNEQASIIVTEMKSGNIIYAYSVHKWSSAKGKQSAGEAIGKHLNEAIGKD